MLHILKSFSSLTHRCNLCWQNSAVTVCLIFFSCQTNPNFLWIRHITNFLPSIRPWFLLPNKWLSYNISILPIFFYARNYGLSDRMWTIHVWVHLMWSNAVSLLWYFWQNMNSDFNLKKLNDGFYTHFIPEKLIRWWWIFFSFVAIETLKHEF